MRNIKKKAVLLVTAVALAATSVTGCSKFNANEVVAKVDDTEISLGLANFYIRYQQGVYETDFAEMLGGIEKMWATTVTEEKTYEDSMKESSIELLEKMCIMEDHMDDYDVELTEEEKAAIDKVAKEFVKANGEEEREVISGDEETVNRFLTLMTIQKKVYDEVIAEADTEVSEDEARRKGMQYVLFPFTTTDEDGKTKTLTEDEKKELKKEAEDFAKTVAKKKDFAGFAEKVGRSAVDSTFGEDTTAPTEEMVKELNSLKVGETTGVHEGAPGYYVARVTSELDEEATNKRKESIIAERQKAKFTEVYEAWEKEAEITEELKLLKKIDFDKQGITVVREEEEEDAETEETDGADADAEDADADNTDAEDAKDDADANADADDAKDAE